MMSDQTPFYLDWTFWTAAVAVAALVLSQLPPVRVLLRRTSLRMQPYDRLNVTHYLGNPIINLHVQILNAGGRTVRVQSLSLEITPEDGSTFTLPAQSFSRADGTPGSFLFTPFSLVPDKEWANFVGFFAPFSMNDERLSKALTKELRTDINRTLDTRSKVSPEKKELVVSTATCVTQLTGFYATHKRWVPGEYSVLLNLRCEPASASVTRRFRFTLFEADAQEFDERASHYNFGAGVYFTDGALTEVYPRIKDLADGNK
jgi:hypothetical protein